MMLQTEGGILAEADARVFQMLMSANRTARRLMAADRTIAGAHRRVATIRRIRQARAAREHAKANRDLAKEMARVGQGWGRTFVIRMEPKRASAKSGSTKSLSRVSNSRRAIRTYAAPLQDKRGRIALYMNIKYRGLKSKGWRPGLAADHIEYITRDAALETAVAANRELISNMGETVDEIMACWHALEAVEEGYRANAKVQYRIVWNLPHELDADQRYALVEEFCDRTFGRLGLPYAAAIHRPDIKSDDRNYHAHICFSTRPCERTADHQWSIAEEKVNGLTNKPGLKLVRALGAAHMNRACRAAGISTLFTHLTYAERGIDAERQAHVGPAAMAAHDRGDHVAMIASNATIVDRNENSVARQRVEQQLDATTHLQRLLAEAEETSAIRATIAVRLEAAQVVLRAAIKIITSKVADQASRNHSQSRETVSRLQTQAVTIQHRIALSSLSSPVLAPTHALRNRAARLIERLTARPGRDTERVAIAVAEQIGERARALRARLVAAPSAPSGTTHCVTGQKVEIACRTVSASINELEQSATIASQSRSELQTVKVRLAQRRATEAGEKLVRVRGAIGSAPLEFAVKDGEVRVDLAPLADDARLAFQSLDQGTQKELLIERYEADQKSKRDEIRRKRALEAGRVREADAEQRRAAQNAEACRVIRLAKNRPYRLDGKTICPDWTALAANERECLNAASIAEPIIQAALKDRVTADARLDRELALKQSLEHGTSGRSRDLINAAIPASVDASQTNARGSVPGDDAAGPNRSVDRGNILITAASLREDRMAGWNAIRPLMAPTPTAGMPDQANATAKVQASDKPRPAGRRLINPRDIGR